MTNQSVRYFTPLAEDECWSLLTDAVVGRIAWRSQHGVVILPINFTVQEPTITFHTAHGSLLSELAAPTEVAFEVDEIDEETAIGWSVLVQGTTGPADPNAPSVTWLTDDRSLPIAITAARVSGRVISGSHRPGIYDRA